MDKIELELPWPDKRLNPNSSVHPKAKIRPKKQAFDDAFYMTRSYILYCEYRPPEKVAITYTFCPPTNHNRDDDNFIAAMKSSRDGIAQALGVDDSCFVTQPVQWGEVAKPGKVIVRLEEIENDTDN